MRKSSAEDVTAKRGAVRADGNDLNDLVPDKNCTNRDAVGERLSHRYDIRLRLGRVLRVRPHRTRAEEATLHRGRQIGQQ